MHSPEMKFAMQAHASALLALAGRTSNIDLLKLARVTLKLQPLPPAHGAAVSAFLDQVWIDPAAAGAALRAFVESILPRGDVPAATVRRFDWQDRADLR